MNLDNAELNKFNAQADSWWDPHGNFRPLHDMNPVRLDWIKAHTALENRHVLDIGCGGGILSESLAKEKAIVTGIDLAANAIETARSHSMESKLSIRYLINSAEELANKETAKYDVITCMELLEHVPDPSSIVTACAKLVKPGGMVFFSTLNRNLKSFCHAIIGAEYILRLLPKGTHDFQRFLTPAELSRFARKADLTVSDITGITCNLQAKKFTLSNNPKINYMLACTKQA